MQEALTLARKVAHVFETDQEPFFENFYSIKILTVSKHCNTIL